MKSQGMVVVTGETASCVSPKQHKIDTTVNINDATAMCMQAKCEKIIVLTKGTSLLLREVFWGDTSFMSFN